MDAGKLVPDEVIIGIVAGAAGRARLRRAASSWTGCPAPSLRPRPWSATGIAFDQVLSLEISDEEIEERMTRPPGLRSTAAPPTTS